MRFESIDEIKAASKSTHMAIPEKDYLACFKDWKIRWYKCISLRGDYFEGDKLDLQEQIKIFYFTNKPIFLSTAVFHWCREYISYFKVCTKLVHPFFVFSAIAHKNAERLVKFSANTAMNASILSNAYKAASSSIQTHC